MNNKGFSLIEIMVAVSILAISLTTLLSYSGNSLLTSGKAEEVTVAAMLARQKMAELEIELDKGALRNEFPEDKSEDGVFEEPYEDYRWVMEIRKVDLPAPVTGEKGSIQDTVGKELSKEISKSVREVKLKVFWGEEEEKEEEDSERKIEVVTHIVKL